jgi:hypothetical protein
VGSYAADALAVAGTVLIVSLSFLLGTMVILVVRAVGDYPSELEKVGSDISLYAYGIVVSLLFAIEAGRPVLSKLPNRYVPLALAIALLATLLTYGYNLKLASDVRKANKKYHDGIRTFRDLADALTDPKASTPLRRSVSLGFFPALSVVLLDLLG